MTKISEVFLSFLLAVGFSFPCRIILFWTFTLSGYGGDLTGSALLTIGVMLVMFLVIFFLSYLLFRRWPLFFKTFNGFFWLLVIYNTADHLLWQIYDVNINIFPFYFLTYL